MKVKKAVSGGGPVAAGCGGQAVTGQHTVGPDCNDDIFNTRALLETFKLSRTSNLVPASSPRFGLPIIDIIRVQTPQPIDVRSEGHQEKREHHAFELIAKRAAKAGSRLAGILRAVAWVMPSDATDGSRAWSPWASVSVSWYDYTYAGANLMRITQV